MVVTYSELQLNLCSIASQENWLLIANDNLIEVKLNSNLMEIKLHIYNYFTVNIID